MKIVKTNCWISVQNVLISCTTSESSPPYLDFFPPFLHANCWRSLCIRYFQESHVLLRPEISTSKSDPANKLWWRLQCRKGLTHISPGTSSPSHIAALRENASVRHWKNILNTNHEKIAKVFISTKPWKKKKVIKKNISPQPGSRFCFHNSTEHCRRDESPNTSLHHVASQQYTNVCMPIWRKHTCPTELGHSDTMSSWYYDTMKLWYYDSTSAYETLILWDHATLILWEYAGMRLQYSETMKVWDYDPLTLWYFIGKIVWYYDMIQW